MDYPNRNLVFLMPTTSINFTCCTFLLLCATLSFLQLYVMQRSVPGKICGMKLISLLNSKSDLKSMKFTVRISKITTYVFLKMNKDQDN